MPKKVKIVILVLFYILFGKGTIIHTDIEHVLSNTEQKLQDTLIKNELLRTKMQRMEDNYRKSLINIVTNLYDRQSYRNVGGTSEDLGYDNDLLYQAILNSTTDFSAFLKDVDTFFDNRKDYLDNIPSTWPVKYNNMNRITSPFGYRVSPFTGNIAMHSGIDITGEYVQELVSTANGTVLKVLFFHPEYGRMVMIGHSYGYKTLYAHMDRIFVKRGQRVKKGQVIGVMGNTGLSMGLHVHYEVRKGNRAVNPIDYLSPSNILVVGD
jgi:murein DD-endopeptidase MepM/ murein hydrolase activator NlpD